MARKWVNEASITGSNTGLQCDRATNGAEVHHASGAHLDLTAASM